MASLKDKFLAYLETGSAPESHLYTAFSPVYHRDSVYKAISSLKNSGEVVDQSGELQLTLRGRSELRERAPYFRFRDKVWDGLWRMVFFDIPEKERAHRDRFRKHLKSHGFGLWQNSMWVSPYSHDFLEDPHQHLDDPVSQRLELFKGLRVSPGSESDISQRVWNIESLNKSYQMLYDQWQESLPTSGEVDISNVCALASTLYNSYLDLLFTDPCLPQQLLPQEWYRDHVSDLVWEWRAFF